MENLPQTIAMLVSTTDQIHAGEEVHPRSYALASVRDRVMMRTIEMMTMLYILVRDCAWKAFVNANAGGCKEYKDITHKPPSMKMAARAIF